jgi:hypothetical protein
MKELIECLKEKTPFTLDPSLTTIYLPIKEGPWMPLIDVLNNNDTLTYIRCQTHRFRQVCFQRLEGAQRTIATE